MSRDKEYMIPDGMEDSEAEQYREIMYVLDSLGHPDTSASAETRKEHIYTLTKEKIGKEKRKYFTLNIGLWTKVAVLLGVISFSTILSVSFYKLGTNLTLSELNSTPIEVSTPKGVISEIELSDGTQVSLNGVSKLAYPALFADKDRRVELVGEAYFDVAKNSDKPFIINAGDLRIRVVGTRFSLQAYANQELITLTVEEGEVEVNDASGMKKESVTANQQFVFNRSSHDFSKQTVNPDYYTAWRKGVLCFRNMHLGDIAKELERKYNVNITFQDESLTKERYFGLFEDNESVEEILSLLSYKNNWSYTKKGYFLEIYKK